MLTAEQVALYRERGFLVVPGFASAAECAALQRRGLELVDELDPAARRAATFSTKDQTNTTDLYFLDSASQVGVFFEVGAVDAATGALGRPARAAANKLGHALHDVDPVFREYSRSGKVVSVLRALGYRRPLPVQSMLHFKSPGVGSEVAAHQDSTFLATTPTPSVIGLWVALEDATQKNGCMWAAPRSHEDGLLRRFVRDGDTLAFEGEPLGEAELAKYEFEPIEVSAGDLVLLHGENIHLSRENTSADSRHAYIVHVVEGAAGHAWSPRNWLQRRADMPFEPLYDDEAGADGGGAA